MVGARAGWKKTEQEKDKGREEAGLSPVWTDISLSHNCRKYNSRRFWE